MSAQNITRPWRSCDPLSHTVTRTRSSRQRESPESSRTRVSRQDAGRRQHQRRRQPPVLGVKPPTEARVTARHKAAIMPPVACLPSADAMRCAGRRSLSGSQTLMQCSSLSGIINRHMERESPQNRTIIFIGLFGVYRCAEWLVQAIWPGAFSPADPVHACMDPTRPSTQ